MSDSRTILFEHVLRTSRGEPLAQRVQLYRALAEYAGDPTRTAELQTLAAQLEEVDQRCFAFARQFARQAELPFPANHNGGQQR